MYLLIDVDNRRGNLTNMHRASKEGDSKRPANWLQTEQAKEFIAALAASLNVGIDYILQAVSGRDGGTWAHWQVCVEYAGYLSPAFAIQWNEYARAYLEGKARPTATAESVAIVEGLDVQVGWHGDAKYWPVKPLAHLCKRGLTAWPNLYAALTASEQWASTVIPVIMVGADGSRRSMVCLPWDRWPAFWLEFGGNNTQSQNVRPYDRSCLRARFTQ